MCVFQLPNFIFYYLLLLLLKKNELPSRALLGVYKLNCKAQEKSQKLFFVNAFGMSWKAESLTS